MDVFTLFLVMTGALNQPHTDEQEPSVDSASQAPPDCDSSQQGTTSRCPKPTSCGSLPTPAGDAKRTSAKLPTFYEGVSTDDLVQLLSTENWTLKTETGEKLPLKLEKAPDSETVQVVDVHTQQPAMDRHVTFKAKITSKFANTPLIIEYNCDKYPETLNETDKTIKIKRDPTYGCMLLTKDQITALYKDKQLGKAIVLQNSGDPVDNGRDERTGNIKTIAWHFGLYREEFGLDVDKTPADILKTPWVCNEECTKMFTPV
jgi:hypothetical protein